MVLKTSENTNSIYRFIEFVSKLSGGGLPHERYKLIVFDEYKALSKEEIEVKRFSDAYLYLLNNINQSFCKEIIEISYYLLTNKHLDEKVINQILETYYLDYNETPHYLASLLHLKVLELIEYKNIEFAFMMSNLVMLKKGRYQLVPITHVFDRYNAFLKDRTIDKLVLIFAAAEAVIKNEQQTVKEQQEIIDIIIKNKDLLKKQYRIKKLYLYGSYSKNVVTTNSDIDFLIVYEKDLSEYERVAMRKETNKFLTDKLESKVDLLDFTHALVNLDISEMENIITII